MKQWSLVIIGSGWRAECFLRILRNFPHDYRISGVISRSEENRTRINGRWDVPVYGRLEDLLEKETPDFAIVAVKKSVAHTVIGRAVALNLPVLAETPPADTLKDLIELNQSLPETARIQIAEQYYLYPMNRARLSLIKSGLLGDIHYAHVSISHGYHGISLIRKILGIGFENPVVRAHSTTFPITEGPGRAGPPAAENTVKVDHTLGVLDFGSRKGLYDFERNQHRSWIRTSRFLVRGERGEINEDRILYLKDFITPVEFPLIRIQAGEYENVEGYYLKGVQGLDRWLYTNSDQVSLSDEDMAILASIRNMTEYLETGRSSYSLAEASQDQYLALMIDKAAEEDRPIETKTQCWAPGRGRQT